MMEIGKLSLEEVKQEIVKLDAKVTSRQASKEERRLYNNLCRKRNQLEKTINKEKKKGDPDERNFQMEFEIDEGCRAIIRNYLDEDLEIKKMEAAIFEKKKTFEGFKRMYHNVIEKYDKIPTAVIEERNVFVKRMRTLRNKIPEDNEEQKETHNNLYKEGMKEFNLVETIGKQNVTKFNIKRKISNFERELKKRKSDSKKKQQTDGEETEEEVIMES